MRFNSWAALVASAVLASCGGGDGETVLEGGVIKGPVSGAMLCVYQVTNGAKGAQVRLSMGPRAGGSIVNGCYLTPDDGSYNVRLPGGTSGDLLMESTGGTFCSNEEVLANGVCGGGGTPVAMGAEVMSSVVAVQGAGKRAYLTPLTTAAVTSAGAQLSASTFDTRFRTLAGQIMGPETTVTPDSAPTAATQAYLAQVADFLKNGGSLSNAVHSLAQGTTTFSGSAGSAPATVNAALVGTYNLVFRAGGGDGCAGTGCTYTDNQSVSLSVTSDGKLSLPGKVLSSPFYRSYGGTPNLHEVIWYDAETRIEYALSDNAGAHFNEINVGDMARQASGGFPRFLGQLRMPEAEGLAGVKALAGVYGNAGEYRGAHSRSQWATVTIGADASITFSGSNPDRPPSIAAADIAQINACAQICGTYRISVNRDINGDSQVTNEDAVTLHLNGDGALRAIAWDPTQNGSSDDLYGVRVVPQGETLPALAHSGAVPPTDTNVIAGTVNASPFSLAGAPTGVANTSFILLDGGSGTGPFWRIQLQPGAALVQGQTYGCRKTSTAEVSVQATLTAGAFPVTTLNGGRCSITVTELVQSGGQITLIRGTFVAEMHDQSRQNDTPRVVLDGVFSWTAPAD